MVKYTLQNSRKKTTKRKTVTKRRNMKRKTRRRRVGSGIIKDGYRAMHKATLGKPSVGEQGEIDDAAKAADLVELEKLRKNPDYTEVNDIEEFKVGATYEEFQGAGAELKNLGQFKREWERGLGYGNYEVTLEFEKGRLGGFSRTKGEAAHRGPEWTTVHNVFKVNSGAIAGDHIGLPREIGKKIETYGGRKRKTRKTKKSRRARK